MSYSQQVLAVLVRERQRAVAAARDPERVHASSAGVRRRLAARVYGLAKLVTVLAVLLDDEPVRTPAERAR